MLRTRILTNFDNDSYEKKRRNRAADQRFCFGYIYRVQLPTQLYFLLLSFKNVNNMKTFVCDYHLNDPTTFLHYQIQVCSVHARILTSGYKNAFSVLHMHGPVNFQNRAQIQNL